MGQCSASQSAATKASLPQLSTRAPQLRLQPRQAHWAKLKPQLHLERRSASRNPPLLQAPQLTGFWVALSLYCRVTFMRWLLTASKVMRTVSFAWNSTTEPSHLQLVQGG